MEWTAGYCDCGECAAGMNGFSAEQRFFLGFAQVWGSKDRPELARALTASDPHPLPQFRVNGTVANMPEFARAFRCKEDDAMVRPANNRCKIW